MIDWRTQAKTNSALNSGDIFNVAENFLPYFALTKPLSGPTVPLVIKVNQPFSLVGHAESIEAVAEPALSNFDPDASGEYHGPDHWARLREHGHAAARASGVDPLVAHVF